MSLRKESSFFVCISNVGDNTTQNDLEKYFPQPFINFVFIKRSFRYQIFVEFSTEKDVLDALSLSGKIRMGHYCPIKVERVFLQPEISVPTTIEAPFVALIKNIGYQITKDTLCKGFPQQILNFFFFEKNCRRCAAVEFSTKEALVEVLKLSKSIEMAIEKIPIEIEIFSHEFYSEIKESMNNQIEKVDIRNKFIICVSNIEDNVTKKEIYDILPSNQILNFTFRNIYYKRHAIIEFPTREIFIRVLSRSANILYQKGWKIRTWNKDFTF